ncbi:MAG: HD domain-containing protein [Bacteroidota bacterium]|nr:HD domain-containing protein [Bacteroidota bacterium]
MLSLPEIQEHVIGKLTKGLLPSLTYHNVAHTLDVLKHVIEIAELEGISNDEELLLLKVSALYHDVGFVKVYSGHEETSCAIAMEELKNFGFTTDQIEKICGMIRATRVPQQPKTQLEEIICDSDLDYLGRDDFFEIGEGLFKEFFIQKIVANEREWNMLQLRFLENHCYFTNSAKQRRQQAKQIHLEKIREKLV